jgi:hypothetical protein
MVPPGAAMSFRAAFGPAGDDTRDRRPCIDPRALTGWVRPMTVCGLEAAELKIECGSPPVDLGRDAYRSKRTERDIRLVGADCYYAVFQVAGRSVSPAHTDARLRSRARGRDGGVRDEPPERKR